MMVPQLVFFFLTVNFVVKKPFNTLQKKISKTENC
ncbi:unnamed protein product [Arabidopsis halleri]